MDWSKFTPQDFEYDFERDETRRTPRYIRGSRCVSFQILRFAEISGIVIAINCLARRWVVENSKSFFN